jgi:hypothetical protein
LISFTDLSDLSLTTPFNSTYPDASSFDVLISWLILDLVLTLSWPALTYLYSDGILVSVFGLGLCAYSRISCLHSGPSRGPTGSLTVSDVAPTLVSGLTPIILFYPGLWILILTYSDSYLGFYSWTYLWLILFWSLTLFTLAYSDLFWILFLDSILTYSGFWFLFLDSCPGLLPWILFWILFLDFGSVYSDLYWLSKLIQNSISILPRFLFWLAPDLDSVPLILILFWFLFWLGFYSDFILTFVLDFVSILFWLLSLTLTYSLSIWLGSDSILDSSLLTVSDFYSDFYLWMVSDYSIWFDLFWIYFGFNSWTILHSDLFYSILDFTDRSSEYSCYSGLYFMVLISFYSYLNFILTRPDWLFWFILDILIFTLDALDLFLDSIRWIILFWIWFLSYSDFSFWFYSDFISDFYSWIFYLILDLFYFYSILDFYSNLFLFYSWFILDFYSGSTYSGFLIFDFILILFWPLFYFIPGWLLILSLILFWLILRLCLLTILFWLLFWISNFGLTPLRISITTSLRPTNFNSIPFPDLPRLIPWPWTIWLGLILISDSSGLGHSDLFWLILTILTLVSAFTWSDLSLILFWLILTYPDHSILYISYSHLIPILILISILTFWILIPFTFDSWCEVA